MKVRIMILVMLVVAAVVGVLRPKTVMAVSGECTNCHVMHAMEGGIATQASLKGGAAVAIAPQDFLLRNTCLGCHAGASAAPNTSTQPPKVYATSGTELAGGNFKYVDDNADTYGHNPAELGNADALTEPPGWKTGFPDRDNNEVGNGGAWGVNKLTCAGVWGCHGNHNATGVKGAHHANTNGQLNAATTVGSSYRFLLGIKGYEDPDYEFTTNAATDHNVYRGEARVADTPTAAKDTISYLCAECHGIFHSGETGAPYSDGTSTDADGSFASPWIRHPVDISMPYTNGTATEYDYYGTYNLTAPVATSQNILPAAMNVTVATDRIVMCLSCHRAHASAQPAALRWQYSNMLAGGGSNATGCFACHTAKDGTTGN